MPLLELGILKIQFSALFSYMLWYIELKFCIRLCFTEFQVKFQRYQFASTFVGVMSLLELRILEIHIFPLFSLACFDILSWNFAYDFVLLYYISSLSVTNLHQFLGHRSQRLQWPIVITRCPASVRRPLNYLHFRLLLQNRLMDFDETWYGWSTQGPLQVLLFFVHIPPEADPGQGKNRSRGVPFFRKLLLQTGRLQQQTECIAVI